MMTFNPVPSENVFSTEFEEGGGVLVDLNTKQYFQLNETGLFVWARLEKGRTVDEIIDEMCSIYDVTPEHARSSVGRLVAELDSSELLKR